MNKSGKYTVDRIEKTKVVLLLRDDEKIQVLVNKAFLPDVQESDIVHILFTESGDISRYERLVDEIENEKAKAKQLLEKLVNRNI
ncbi:DUF3006 family protein [Priestia abyssalis]|uniref:DUF3006 family protein n=1 Tax=Priestia abyssalis TaxID=1221450 RepID=UPI0014764D15|nr:DUF3006 family protein [Priestia abyssalis]